MQYITSKCTKDIVHFRVNYTFRFLVSGPKKKYYYLFIGFFLSVY